MPERRLDPILCHCKCKIVLLLLLASLSACAQWPFMNGKRQTASAAALIAIDNAGLLVSRERVAELGLTLRNVSATTLWVSVTFERPDKRSSAVTCTVGKELVSGARGLYLCPQPGLPVIGVYPLRIAIFDRVEQQTPLARINSDIRISLADQQRLRELTALGAK